MALKKEDGMVTVKSMVFDLGGVLIHWDPRLLYRKLLPEPEVEEFLRQVCDASWNEQQDAGRPFAEAVGELSTRFPEHAELIAAYDERWAEMLGGALDDTVAILGELRQRGTPLYALSNWSAEKFPIARARFAFLAWFDGTVISGEWRTKKPDRRIFNILLEQHQLVAPECLFIDDSVINVRAAGELGFETHHFVSAPLLRERLVELGILDA
jgi:2-haloacid dehalogenase